MAMRRTFPTKHRPYVPRSRSPRRVARPWTREEIAFMRKFYRNYETAWIARQLGRTVYSVRYKAVDLNIRKASPTIWKGNTGNANAFHRPTTGRWNQTTWTRKTRPRRSTRTRTMRAVTRRRTPRTGKPRRTNRNYM